MRCHVQNGRQTACTQTQCAAHAPLTTPARHPPRVHNSASASASASASSASLFPCARLPAQAADVMAAFFERCTSDPGYWAAISAGGLARIASRCARMRPHAPACASIAATETHVQGTLKHKMRRHRRMHARMQPATRICTPSLRMHSSTLLSHFARAGTRGASTPSACSRSPASTPSGST